MTAYETFACRGGPLGGWSIEVASEDVMHPNTVSIRIIREGEHLGTYFNDGFEENRGRVMRWQPS